MGGVAYTLRRKRRGKLTAPIIMILRMKRPSAKTGSLQKNTAEPDELQKQVLGVGGWVLGVRD